MLSRQCAPLTHGCRNRNSVTTHLRYYPLRQQTKHRTLWTQSLQTLTDGFLDLAIALPYPLSFPPYASTIILTTVITRTLFTLPFSIWAKKRQWRIEEEVLPELLKYRNNAAKRIAQEMKFAGLAKGGIDQFKKTHTERLTTAISKRRDELFREHSCAPLLTMIVPAVTQLPIFVISTIFFSNLAVRPTPLESEEFLTLTSLARPDPTAALPIALGLTTLANVETAHWFVGEERAEKDAKRQEAKEALDRKKMEEGVPVLPTTKDLIQGGLRLFSIARIVFGVMVDGSVIIYWLTSATFGLFQSWGFNWWDARRAIRRRRLGASSTESKART